MSWRSRKTKRPRLAVKRNWRRAQFPSHWRLTAVQAVVVLVLFVIIGRLFHIQVMQHAWYSALASDQHGIFAELFPERGQIWLSDPKADDGLFPIAVNKSLTMVYADTRNLEKADIKTVAVALVEELGWEDTPAPAPQSAEDAAGQGVAIAAADAVARQAAAKAAAVTAMEEKLSVPDDPYVPIKGKVDDQTAKRLRDKELPGIGFSKQSFRFYPEKETACHLTGFVGSNENGEQAGRYGIEGYWNEELAGRHGFIQTETDPGGRFITAGGHDFQPAVDGSDIRLTIDRNIQFVACTKLREAVSYHQAASGAVVVLEPESGRVLAMCGSPEFDPNRFNEVGDISAFNNPATYYAYEPGSVFKPFTMAAAIDAGKVTPKTVYLDEGEVKIGKYTIKNSDGKRYGRQTMTQVLEKSLNTGAIFAAEQLGANSFRQYMEAFGFGERTGIGITEAAGDISSLSKRGDIWSATASYGQGITATPIQVAAAFAVLANDGKLLRPYLVEEVRRPDGTIERTEPQAVRQVVSKRAADLVSGMLVRVVEDGHGKKAAVPGYWVAGKTGTAQVSSVGQVGYADNVVNVTFVGYAPVDDPAFVLLTKLGRPEGAPYASDTAAPLFGEIAGFLLQYLQIPPDRPIR